MSRIRAGVFLCVLCGLCVLGAAARAAAQTGGVAMPDPKQMSGIPRPVPDLPNGSVGVLLIVGDFSHPVANHEVQAHAGSKVLTQKTDDTGHVTFSGLAPGQTVKVTADLDGEHLESQEFPAPEQGGVRLMLVGTDKAKAAAAAAAAAAPPTTGQVVLGGESRIVIEPNDESITVYYLLDITNTARGRVNTPRPFMFDMPTGATGTTVLDGSAPGASVNGTRLRVQGPFAPGRTFVQVAYELPVSGGSIQFDQEFPAALQQMALIVKKVGGTKLTSPQVSAQQDMSADGETYIAATGPAVAAGNPITIKLDGMPHHSTTGRWTALLLAIAILVAGVWALTRPENREAQIAERKRLVARRDKLFNELVRLEREHRQGRGDPSRYTARREELVGALEHLYGVLDDDETAPDPTDHAGLAA
ncbi:MAG: hypothetical protein ACM3SQ_14445 [Betaproteobacteria bacterium]